MTTSSPAFLRWLKLVVWRCALLIWPFLVAFGFEDPSKPVLQKPNAVPAIPAAPQGDAVANRQRSELIQKLISENSIESLESLLNANLVRYELPEQMGCSHVWKDFPDSNPQTSGLVTRLTTVVSSGQEYVIVPCSVKSRMKNAFNGVPLSDVVYVFEKSGGYVGKLGGGFEASGLRGNEVLITDLGSKQDWFALVTRFDDKGIFEETTRVHHLKPALPCLVTIRHRLNDLDLPICRTKNTIPFKKPFIRFMGKDKSLMPPSLGIDQEGKQAIPEIVFNEIEGVFEGASVLTYKKEFVFEVDVKESPGFKTRSIPRWSDELSTALKRIRDSQEGRANEN